MDLETFLRAARDQRVWIATRSVLVNGKVFSLLEDDDGKMTILHLGDGKFNTEQVNYVSSFYIKIDEIIGWAFQ